MHIAIMTVTFSLPACASLKEKRQRIGGLHERLGRNPSNAVCESGQRGVLNQAEWTFIMTGISKSEVDSLCSTVEEKLQSRVDGYILDLHREYL